MAAQTNHLFQHRWKLGNWILVFTALLLVLLIPPTSGQLVAPSDVSLQNYNITDFEILVSNITTNLTLTQQEIVMTTSSNFLPSVIIPLRLIVALLFDPILFISIFMLRNYEPLRSKLVISLILTGINVICHIPNIMAIIPVMKLLFQSYWNQFQNEMMTKPGMNAETFYQNNLDSNRLPTWLGNYIVFENVYCFIESYLIHALILACIALYAIQLGKLILLTIMKNLRHSIVTKIQEYRKKKAEKLQNVKTKPKTIQVSNSNVRKSKSNLSLDLTQVKPISGSLSARSDSITTLELEDMALDLTFEDDEISSSVGFDEISKKGRIINMIKRAVKYRVIEITFISIVVIVWYIIISQQISVHKIDIWSFVFQNWDSYSGYCRNVDRLDHTRYNIVVSVTLFGIIPILMVVDLIFCLMNYVKARNSNKEKGEKTSNFIIYYIYETDPFVYRAESISIIIIACITLIVFLILDSSTPLVTNLFFIFGLNFLGGSGSNPGITILRTLWNYILMVRSKKADSKKNKQVDSNEFQNIQQLVSAPISTYSVQYVISHKKERDLFYQYLKEEYSVENLLFIEDLQTLHKIDEKHIRGKLGKIKEIAKLYLDKNDSIFEINVPSKLIDKELKDFKELMKILSEENIKVDQLPKRIVKDSQTVYFPNLESSKEQNIRNLILNLCTPTLFDDLSIEVHKNMLDSYYRFNHSRKWKEYVKSVTEQP